ncbi:MAG: hypothetical protein WD342_17125, partial [Verrucomicrobiales bacterium]
HRSAMTGAKPRAKLRTLTDIRLFVAVQVAHGELGADPGIVVDELRPVAGGITLPLQLEPPRHCRCIGSGASPFPSARKGLGNPLAM